MLSIVEMQRRKEAKTLKKAMKEQQMQQRQQKVNKKAFKAETMQKMWGRGPNSMCGDGGMVSNSFISSDTCNVMASAQIGQSMYTAGVGRNMMQQYQQYSPPVGGNDVRIIPSLDSQYPDSGPLGNSGKSSAATGTTFIGSGGTQWRINAPPFVPLADRNVQLNQLGGFGNFGGSPVAFPPQQQQPPLMDGFIDQQRHDESWLTSTAFHSDTFMTTMRPATPPTTSFNLLQTDHLSPTISGAQKYDAMRNRHRAIYKNRRLPQQSAPFMPSPSGSRHFMKRHDFHFRQPSVQQPLSFQQQRKGLGHFSDVSGGIDFYASQNSQLRFSSFSESDATNYGKPLQLPQTHNQYQQPCVPFTEFCNTVPAEGRFGN